MADERRFGLVDGPRRDDERGTDSDGRLETFGPRSAWAVESPSTGQLSAGNSPPISHCNGPAVDHP